MTNDNANPGSGFDCDPPDVSPTTRVPLRVVIVGDEILIDVNSTPSLTADAAELTGRRLIDAALDLRELRLLSEAPAALAIGKGSRPA